MFSSKKAVTGISDVPSAWVFENYLDLPEKLEGYTVMIKSVFNPLDTVPSMSIYVNRETGNYNFCCHSTGLKGGMLEIVEHLFSLDKKSAIHKIINDYKNYLLKNEPAPLTTFVAKDNWKVASFKIRAWNSMDVSFWAPYNIGSKLLDMYNVKPLSSFVLEKENEQMYISADYLTYAYLSKTGEVHKIYQPRNQNKKFMTFSKYIQGWDQVEGKSRLFICSSLKDIMSMRSLGIDGDYIAPQSENSGIELITNWVSAYPEKYVIFDNDEAGLKSMQMYERVYRIPYVHLDMSKDISDSVKEHGARAVKSRLITLLK